MYLLNKLTNDSLPYQCPFVFHLSRGYLTFPNSRVWVNHSELQVISEMTDINLAKEVNRLALCHKLTCRPWLDQHLPSLKILLRRHLKFVFLNLPICYQRKALSAIVEALQGLSSSARSHQESCLSPPVILDSVHLSQAPGDLGQCLMWCHPGHATRKVLLMSTLCTVHICFSFAGGQLKGSNTNFYSAVIQILHSQHNP